MGFPAKVLWVIIASPSDLGTERSAIAEEIYQWNNHNSESLGVVLLPRRWETDVTPGLGGRPQDMVNEQIVENSDILVGVFWSRLGSPPGVDHKGIEHVSGTAEEIQTFVESGKRALIYFSKAPLPNDVDTDQLARLRTFKEEMRSNGILEEFDDFSAMLRHLERHLTNVVRETAKKSASNSLPGDRETQNSQHHQTPSSSPPSKLEYFREHLDQILEQLRIAWRIEQESASYKIDDAKTLLRSVRNQLYDLRVAAGSDLPRLLAEPLESIIADMSKLQQHRLYIDGGRSFREFWLLGGEILERLEAVSLATNVLVSSNLDPQNSQGLDELSARKACLRFGLGAVGVQIGEAGSDVIAVDVPLQNVGDAPAFDVRMSLLSELDAEQPDVIDQLSELSAGESRAIRFLIPLPPPRAPQADIDRLYRVRVQFSDSLGSDRIGCALHIFGQLPTSIYGKVVPERTISSPLCARSATLDDGERENEV